MKHGGDISLAATQFGGDAEATWLDLSTGIAPEPYPLPEIATSAWQKLPQQGALDQLLATARLAYGAADDVPTVAAPGTQLLIQLLPLLRPGSDVRILGPTYSEHEICWRRTAKQVSVVNTFDALDGADVAVITNPNNPDGRIVPADQLLALAEKLAKRNGMLIVDEAFADVMPETSIASRAGKPGLLILRSFGKFYGLAGVRLGFALGCEQDIAALDALIGPWAVAGPALTIGVCALGDAAWATAARQRYQDQAQQLDALLAKAGFELVGGTPLFRLVRHDDAVVIHAHLASRGILTRIFDDHPTWMRIGLPGHQDQVARFTQALDASPALVAAM